MPRKYIPTFNHSQIKKLIRLLDMMYKPSEIADEIGVSVDTIRRSYIPAGLPIEKDTTGHTWINGASFAKWAKEQKPSRKKVGSGKMPDDQAFCLRCKKSVPFPINPQKIIPINRYLEMMQATCPICGVKVNKARSKKRV